jgi:hypothetical protein
MDCTWRMGCGISCRMIRDLEQRGAAAGNFVVAEQEGDVDAACACGNVFGEVWRVDDCRGVARRWNAAGDEHDL